MSTGIPYKKEPMVYHHSISFNTIGPFSGISVGLSGTANGNLKYHSIPLNVAPNFKYHSNTIQIPLAIIPRSTIQIVQWYLNDIFLREW